MDVLSYNDCMSTFLKNQALDVNVVGEEGFGGLRYYNDKLSVYQNGEWVDLTGGGGIPVESITLTYGGTSHPGFVGADCSPYAINAVILPANATNTDLAWSSSDTSIVTVNSNGVATYAGTGGQVTITATAQDGSGVTGNITFYPDSATPC